MDIRNLSNERIAELEREQERGRERERLDAIMRSTPQLQTLNRTTRASANMADTLDQMTRAAATQTQILGTYATSTYESDRPNMPGNPLLGTVYRNQMFNGFNWVDMANPEFQVNTTNDGGHNWMGQRIRPIMNEQILSGTRNNPWDRYDPSTSAANVPNTITHSIGKIKPDSEIETWVRENLAISIKVSKVNQTLEVVGSITMVSTGEVLSSDSDYIDIYELQEKLDD